MSIKFEDAQQSIVLFYDWLWLVTCQIYLEWRLRPCQFRTDRQYVHQYRINQRRSDAGASSRRREKPGILGNRTTTHRCEPAENWESVKLIGEPSKISQEGGITSTKRITISAITLRDFTQRSKSMKQSIFYSWWSLERTKLRIIIISDSCQ